MCCTDDIRIILIQEEDDTKDTDGRDSVNIEINKWCELVSLSKNQ